MAEALNGLRTIPEQFRDAPMDDDVPVEELARRQGVRRLASLTDLAHPDAWESDQEFDEFLADLYASRRSDGS